MTLRIVKKPSTPSEPDLHRQAIQKLASKVTDEAHWKVILASAETEASRQELERVVGPMLAFRRAAPCTTPECASGGSADWQPVLVVASPLAPNEPSWVPIELRLCESCKAQADVRDFLTDGIWAQILEQWDQESPPPVRRLTTLSFDRIH